MQLPSRIRELLGAEAGACSEVTKAEVADRQLTVVSDESDLIYRRYKPTSIYRGAVGGNREKAFKDVVVYQGLNKYSEEQLAFNYPKDKGNELRLYFKKGVFEPEYGDTWFVFLREVDQRLFIGYASTFSFLETLAEEPGPQLEGAVGQIAARVKREIASRRGQPAFRKKLMERFEGRCCVTGSSVPEVLEAAHIKTLTGADDHSETNGLLLRADVHTLFDLNLLSIDPETRTVRVDKKLEGTEYFSYNKAELKASSTVRESIDAAALAYRAAAMLKIG